MKGKVKLKRLLNMKCDPRLPKFKFGYELQKDLDSVQGILDRLDTFGNATVSDERDKIVIAKTLKKLPRNVRDKVLSEVLFIMMRAVGTTRKLVLSYWINKEDIEKKKIGDSGAIGGCIEKPIIILDFCKMRRPSTFEGTSREYRQSVIAHEIAHFILEHHNMPSEPGMERQADDQVERWRFKRAYESYNKFEE
jgi:hypothetical protein